MASCETVRFLASILNRLTDRLAILCTSLTHAGDTDSKIVRDLSYVHLEKIKTGLDALTTTSNERMKPSDWIVAIDCAKRILLESTVPDPEEEVCQDTFGHIFLLTPGASELPSQSLTHDDLTFHIICPASVPRNQVPVYCNGWKIRSLSGNEAQVVSKRKDVDPMSVTNRLRALITHARSGKRLGNATELLLEFAPGPGFIVKGALGNVKLTKLHAGEVFTVLFKLTAHEATIQDDSLPGTPTLPPEAFSSTHGILSQLDRLLGTTERKICTARLTYKHSLLPADTTCSVRTDCHVNSRPPDPSQGLISWTSNSSPARDCTVLVDRRYAYYLSTQGSPRTALKALHDEFNGTYQSSACREYIHLLTTELKYQARIAERLELAASPYKKKVNAIPPTPPTPPPPLPPLPPPPPRSKCSTSSSNKTNWSPMSSISSFNTAGADANADENGRPLHRKTSDIPTEELFKTEPALAVLSLKESREKLRTDKARKIWGDYRRMKRPPSDDQRHHRSISNGKAGSRRRSWVVDEEASKLAAVRELAVRNQRSVGSDTLRSMFSVGDKVGKGFGAPWL